jgi:hypothetical protein
MLLSRRKLSLPEPQPEPPPIARPAKPRKKNPSPASRRSNAKPPPRNAPVRSRLRSAKKARSVSTAWAASRSRSITNNGNACSAPPTNCARFWKTTKAGSSSKKIRKADSGAMKRQRLNERRRRRSRQKVLFCFRCTVGTPRIRGWCRRCYDSFYRSERYFAGLREEVLARDGNRCCVCHGREKLVPHHRRPGVNDPRWLITVCAVCHAKLHRSLRLKRYEPSLLLELWAEQHPDCPRQCQFPFEAAS